MRVPPGGPYIDTGSQVHALDARFKLTAALSLMIVAIGAPTNAAWLLAISAALLGASTALSRIPARSLLFRMAPITGLILIAGLGILFEGTWDRFLFVSTKALLCAWCGVLTSAATPFGDVIGAMRCLGVPNTLITITGLGYRLAFVALDEALRMMSAYLCRVPSARPLVRIRHVCRLGEALIRRVMRRTERMEWALHARAFDGSLRGLPLSPLRLRERLILVATGGITIGLLALAYR